ncbi:serine protein kinase RIO [Glycomyces xiaoerkulensis]|uniref:serine protein kinase RIO n=1 Tax=Glycomyces xiaoerkulensis TaxID=2038139 RepID=UPI001E3ED3BB|nr:RIO1 family regulatory kinase/ATPase [Glycomyces xiaoerkulensis]
MARRPDRTSTFQSTARRRPVDEDEVFSPQERERFEAMRSADPDDHGPCDDGPPSGDRWSIWDQSEPLQRGPRPWPDWIITDLGAVDHELGVLKTGKEADVHLIERAVPGTDRATVMASKRYRSAEHTHFNRAADYTAGRTARRSRDRRALAKRTRFGLEQAAGRWAAAEFDALQRLHTAGVAVPYPVQILGTEVIMEFVGADRAAAPRLAETRPDEPELESLWDQACENLRLMTEHGFTHGDLSAYNTVVHDGRLILLDLPQIVDIYANPMGREFLVRDVQNLGGWFTARGMDAAEVGDLQSELTALAGMP